MDQCSNNAGHSSDNSTPDENDIYSIKWINWFNEKTAIITQNKNGPCPLLAIFNVLLLSKRVNLSDVLEMISSKQIMDYIGGVIFDDMPSDQSDADKLNYEQHMSDAIAIFAKLNTGIDVNVQFKSVSSFECTREISVFDLLRIPLFHGWLPDPQDISAFPVVDQHSYNQILDRIISSKDSSDEDVIRDGLIAEQFLNSTATQLTCHGVVKILETMHDGQLAVFFRNNHFTTLIKKKNELFTLVTDQGFLTHADIVWETLSNVQGDTHFTDANFHTSPLETSLDVTNLDMTPEQQINNDYQVALSLQESPVAESPPSGENVTETNEDSDRIMAERLQQEYDVQASQEARASARNNQRAEQENRQSDKCAIL